MQERQSAIEKPIVSRKLPHEQPASKSLNGTLLSKLNMGELNQEQSSTTTFRKPEREIQEHSLKGSLDYDANLSQESTKDVSIKIVYPTKQFGEENTEFKKRHESMQADADEHYKLLVDM